MTFVKGMTPWNKGRTGIFDGDKNPRWNGGIYINGHGYRYVTAPKGHPYVNVRGYVREHRLVMENSIGRYLHPEEDVHHLNHDKLDNRIENLELFPSRSAHLKKHHQTGGRTTWFKKGHIPMNKYLTPKICQTCLQEFQPKNSINVSKFCSKQCYWNNKKGQPIAHLTRSR